MKDLFFVTSNRNKFEEARKALEEHSINLIISDINIPEKKYPTEKEVAIAKAYAAIKLLKAPLIVEDTGIYFEAYNNFPGPNAHIVFEGIGYEGILKLLEGKNRAAFFRTTITFIKPELNPISFTGECKGKISEKVSERVSFAYDALFMPENETRTFSEMKKEEKEVFSHRRKAVEEFIKWYKESES